jgi:UTP-glucose-1-phosphate uridylyltransferase
MPQEPLPIVDKPLIQYAAEEAIAAVNDISIFMTGRDACAIEDHFDANNELETMLCAKGKDTQADMTRNIIPQEWSAYLCVRPNSWVLATRLFVRNASLAVIPLLFCWRMIF